MRSNCQRLLNHRKGKIIPEKTSASVLLTMPKPLTMWIPTNCKILQARCQQYMNHKLPDIQAGFRKGTRDQIANIHWIVEKAREFQKNIYFCFIDYAKAFDCVDHNKLWKTLRDGNTRPPDLPLEKFVCRSGSNS